MTTIDEAESLLREGMRLSKQSSFERRAPAHEAIPILQESVRQLRVLTEHNPGNAKGWSLLSLAYECLLKYDSAIECLRKSIAIVGKSSKPQQKRLAMIESYAKKWSEFSLNADQLRDLEEFLKLKQADARVDVRTFEFTQEWLKANSFENADVIFLQLEDKGAFSDFQVYHNVCRG